MYKAILDHKHIASAQKSFLQLIRNKLGTKMSKVVVGHPGGSICNLDVFTNSSTIWFANQSLQNRYWNAFGAGLPTLRHSNCIVVEVNIALQGIDRRIAGLFAIDNATGNTTLLHRGKIGGGGKGIGRNAFMKWYPIDRKVSYFDPSRDEEETAIFVADLESDNFLSDIEYFVNTVDRFKVSVLSDSEIVKRAAAATTKPKSSTTQTVIYSRNRYVVELAKRRARGKCELCKQPAPFTNALNEPYLECHHIVWLAHGGADCTENTVALCPNCHRKMHVVNDLKDIEKLQRCANTSLRN